MPEVLFWEAVALSLNIEPTKTKTESDGWMGSDHPFVEGEEFDDRLQILRANHNRKNFPTPCTLNLSCWHLFGVRVDEFATWAHSIGWAIPSELADLAKTESTSPSETPEAAADERAAVGLTKNQIADAFRDIKFSFNKWIKNLGDPPDWLKSCLVVKGAKGGNSATWNPVQIGLALMDMPRNIPIKKLDAVFVRLKAWQAEWQDKTANDRDQ